MTTENQMFQIDWLAFRVEQVLVRVGFNYRDHIRTVYFPDVGPFSRVTVQLAGVDLFSAYVHRGEVRACLGGLSPA